MCRVRKDRGLAASSSRHSPSHLAERRRRSGPFKCWIAVLALAGCGGDLSPVAEADRQAFQAAFAASQRDLAALRACRDAGSLPSDADRMVEVREARLAFLGQDAVRHRLSHDVQQSEQAEPAGSPYCDSFDQLIEQFDRNALTMRRLASTVIATPRDERQRWQRMRATCASSMIVSGERGDSEERSTRPRRSTIFGTNAYKARRATGQTKMMAVQATTAEASEPGGCA